MAKCAAAISYSAYLATPLGRKGLLSGFSVDIKSGKQEVMEKKCSFVRGTMKLLLHGTV